MPVRRVVRRITPARWERAGLTPGQERRFRAATTALLVLFVLGWTYALASAAGRGEAPVIAGRLTASPLSPTAPPEAAFLTDAAVRAFAAEEIDRGLSGEVRVAVRASGDTISWPDTVSGGGRIEYQSVEDTAARGSPASTPGIWNVLVRAGDAARQVPDFAVITLVPLSEKRAGRIGAYRIGSWPYETGGRPKSPEYAPPRGLVRVTPQNMNVRVSEHFRLRDFLTKGQEDVWPKYVAMSPRLLDKLELTIQELEAMGHPVNDVGIISGFRTPWYNAHGGSTGGRGALSRHMYGDAMDWYVDNDRDGRIDDLNRDGSHGFEDVAVIAQAAERVEKKHPQLVGGIGRYRPTGAHSGFIHIDTRGYRARW